MKKDSRTRNSALNAVTGIGGQLLMTILKFVTRTVFIHVLGVEYLGIGGLFQNVLQLLSLTELGIDTAINFKLYKPLAEGDDERVRVLMKFYKNAYRLIGLAILFLGLLLIPLLPLLIKDYERLEVLKIDAVLVYLLYLLQCVSTYWFFAYKSAIVKAAQKNYVLNIVDYAVTILTNAAQIIILVVYHDFMLYVGTVIVFNIVRNGVNAKVADKMFPKIFIPERKNISLAEIKEIIKDCLALFLYKINAVVLHATDNLVLSSFIGLSIVGLYSNYLLFYTTIRTFTSQLYSSVKASMGNVFATESIRKSYLMFKVMNFMTILLYGTACVGIGVMSSEIIECWIGYKYVIPQPLPVLLGIALLFAGLKNNLNQVRDITGAFRQMWFRPLLGIIINIVVSVVLVQYIGICGVLVGTISADLLTNFMVDPSVIHKYSFQGLKPVSEYYKRNLVYLLVLALTGYADYLLCLLVLPGQGIYSVLVHVMICGASVPVVFMALYWKTAECQYIVSKGKPVVKKLIKH